MGKAGEERPTALGSPPYRCQHLPTLGPRAGHTTLAWAVQLHLLLLLLGVFPLRDVHRTLNLGLLHLLLLMWPLRLIPVVLGHAHHWLLACKHSTAN